MGANGSHSRGHFIWVSNLPGGVGGGGGAGGWEERGRCQVQLSKNSRSTGRLPSCQQIPNQSTAPRHTALRPGQARGRQRQAAMACLPRPAQNCGGAVLLPEGEGQPEEAEGSAEKRGGEEEGTRPAGRQPHRQGKTGSSRHSDKVCRRGGRGGGEGQRQEAHNEQGRSSGETPLVSQFHLNQAPAGAVREVCCSPC